MEVQTIMRNFIDTIFGPVLAWLTSAYNDIHSMRVAQARPIDFNNYFGWFGLLGPSWTLLVMNICLFGFIYFIVFIVVSQEGLYQKFKNAIKWW